MEIQVDNVHNAMTLTTEEAARLLRGAGIKIETVTLRDGIEQGVFPFGICIERGTRVFIISKKKFSEWCADFFGVDVGLGIEGGARA